MQCLVQNKRAYVAWCKRFIKLDHQLSLDDDEDGGESSPPRDDHSLFPTEEITLPSLLPCHHPWEARKKSPSLPCPPPSSLAPTKEKTLPPSLSALRKYNSRPPPPQPPKTRSRASCSRRKGPRIRSLMLPKWTNKKRKGRWVVALQTWWTNKS